MGRGCLMHDDFDPWDHLDDLRCDVETGLTIVAVIDAREARGEMCPDDPRLRDAWRRRLASWQSEWSPELQAATGLVCTTLAPKGGAS